MPEQEQHQFDYNTLSLDDKVLALIQTMREWHNRRPELFNATKNELQALWFQLTEISRKLKSQPLETSEQELQKELEVIISKMDSNNINHKIEPFKTI
jgi:hypothetical protein